MYTMQHDRGDALPSDALPSAFAVLRDDQAAIGRELAAFTRGWGSADSESATRLALVNAATRILEVRAAQGDAHRDHLTLLADLEERVKAGIFPLPAGAAHAQPWALGKLFLQAARLAWVRWCERQAQETRTERMLEDTRAPQDALLTGEAEQAAVAHAIAEQEAA